VILSGQRGINLIKPLKQTVQLIKQNNINIVHTWGSGLWDLVGLIAGRICRVLVIHNGIRSAPGRLNFYNRLTRLGARFADAVVANSAAGLKAFKLANLPKSRVIYNGLDTSRFEDIQIIGEGQNVCMVANFSDAKDQKCLILAVAEVLPQYPEVKLHLVGHDYGSLDACTQLVEELKIGDHVKFFTDCSHPEPIIGKCQICVLATNEATHGEGISNAILEYMALGKPVIASQNGGNAEVVVDQRTGFLVEPVNPEAISEKLVYLLENPGIAVKMGREGKAFVHEQFSLAKMEENYTRLYQEFIH
jgi:glycosyltransferase involved in cell wall biosynthesis